MLSGVREMPEMGMRYRLGLVSSLIEPFSQSSEESSGSRSLPPPSLSRRHVMAAAVSGAWDVVTHWWDSQVLGSRLQPLLWTAGLLPQMAGAQEIPSSILGVAAAQHCLVSPVYVTPPTCC